MSNPDYLHGSRCLCRHDRAVYWANRAAAIRGQPRMVPAVGTMRRVQALQAIGHTTAHIAELSGVGEIHVRRLGHGDITNVFLYVHQAIKVVYEKLENVRGPSNHTAGRAHRKGWAVPAAWDDIDDPKEVPKP